jgi:hypothetical protein
MGTDTMRKLNPKFGWHNSAKERAKIKRLTLAGIRPSVIARIMHLTAPPVSKTQRAMGLPTCLPTPERETVELFTQGWSGKRIREHLGVPANRIWAVHKKYGFKKADGTGAAGRPKGDIRGFIEAVKRRDDYIKRLAEKYGLGICYAKKLAHEVLATLQFRPGASKPPLSSDFPQRHFDARRAGPED